MERGCRKERRDRERELVRINRERAAWVAQLFKHLTLAQVMISLFVGPSPALGSVLTAWNLEPASDSVFVSLPLPCSRSVSLSQILKKKTHT